MPVMKCSRKGESGFKFGSDGFCYTGEGAEDKAKRQGRAIERSKAIESGREKPGK